MCWALMSYIDDVAGETEHHVISWQLDCFQITVEANHKTYKQTFSSY